MQINIRKAIEKDCKSMMQLVQELAIYEKAPTEVTVSLQHFTESGFGKNPVWWAFVAEVDNTVIGMALYYIRFSTWKGQRMYLEDIIITEAYRGNGIGKLLMNALIKEASEKNLTAICWQVLDWNDSAIQFYKKYQTAFDAEWINCRLDIIV